MATNNPLQQNALEAERSIVGACLLDPESAAAAVDLIEPRDFQEAKHRTVFVAVREILQNGGKPDLVTVYPKAASQSIDASWLSALTDNTHSGPTHVQQWAHIVKDAASRRKLIAAGKRLSAEAMSPAVNVAFLLDQHEEALRAIVNDASRQAQNTAAPSATQKTGFQLLRLSEITLCPPDWLVRDFLESCSVAMLFGDPGCFKSFLAIDLAACVATGADFHGKKVKQSPVVFIAGEGQNGIKKRFAAWGIRHQCNLDAFPLFVSNMATNLLDAASVNEVVRQVDAVAAQHGAPALIVIDTLARNFGRGDESSSQDGNAFNQAADRFKHAYNCCVLVVHHSGHQEKNRARGSSAIKGAMDFEYRVSRDQDGAVRVECTKVKDHEEPAPMAFRPRSVELPLFDDEGRVVTSAILDSIDFAPPPKTGKAGRGKHQTRAVELLRELLHHHQQNLEDDGRDPSSARVTVSEWRDACLNDGQIERNRFGEVKKSLEDHGVVVVENGFIRLLKD